MCEQPAGLRSELHTQQRSFCIILNSYKNIFKSWLGNVCKVLIKCRFYWAKIWNQAWCSYLYACWWFEVPKGVWILPALCFAVGQSANVGGRGTKNASWLSSFIGLLDKQLAVYGKYFSLGLSYLRSSVPKSSWTGLLESLGTKTLNVYVIKLFHIHLRIIYERLPLNLYAVNLCVFSSHLFSLWSSRHSCPDKKKLLDLQIYYSYTDSTNLCSRFSSSRLGNTSFHMFSSFRPCNTLFSRFSSLRISNTSFSRLFSFRFSNTGFSKFYLFRFNNTRLSSFRLSNTSLGSPYLGSVILASLSFPHLGSTILISLGFPHSSR